MDPVPSAVAQEGGATGVGPAPALTYTQHVVKCDQLIKVANTNYPAAVLQIDPPSLLTAGRVISVVANASVVGWLQAGVGGMVKPDGSAVGGLCAKDTDTVTFLVPDN